MQPKPHTYNQEFELLATHLNQMAQLVGELLRLAIANLGERSGARLDVVSERLEVLQELDMLSEQRVTLFLMHRTPMGEDLRRVTTTVRMTSELARMGALAAHIARRAVGLEGYKAKKSVKRLLHMAELVSTMFDKALAILQFYDVTQFSLIFIHDAEVNERYQDLSSDIQEIMAEKPGKIEQCTHLLFIAKHLENLGDRTKDLALAARFIATGETAKDAVPVVAPEWQGTVEETVPVNEYGGNPTN